MVNVTLQDITQFIEKELVSKRFILALILTAGYLMGKVPDEIEIMMLGFYFGSHVANST